jgi:hypothetical protein
MVSEQQVDEFLRMTFKTSQVVKQEQKKQLVLLLRR